MRPKLHNNSSTEAFHQKSPNFTQLSRNTSPKWLQRSIYDDGHSTPSGIATLRHCSFNLPLTYLSRVLEFHPIVRVYRALPHRTKFRLELHSSVSSFDASRTANYEYFDKTLHIHTHTHPHPSIRGRRENGNRLSILFSNDTFIMTSTNALTLLAGQIREKNFKKQIEILSNRLRL